MSPYTSSSDDATCNTSMSCSVCGSGPHSGTMSHSKVNNHVDHVKLLLSIPAPLFDATNGVTMRMSPRPGMDGVWHSEGLSTGSIAWAPSDEKGELCDSSSVSLCSPDFLD